MPNEFLDELRATSTLRAADPSAGVLSVLDEFCEGIQSFTSNKAVCRRTRGFVTSLGQEWRIVIQSASGGPEQILLRAHVPQSGYPVKLDLYEEQLTDCPDEPALRSELKRALALSGIQDTINYFAR
jgi:hypothetical protein